MVKVKSYANIAIVKYWGKKNAEKMIPATSSISLTLNDMFTETEMEFINNEDIKIAVEKEIKSENCKDKYSDMADLFVKTAIENGASGAKISGGGLGGCVIALAENLEIMEKVKDGFTKCGAENIWVEKI